jgi:hypothetical protein
MSLVVVESLYCLMHDTLIHDTIEERSRKCSGPSFLTVSLVVAGFEYRRHFETRT